MALIHTLSTEQKEAFYHEKKLKAGKLAFTFKGRDKQEGSLEATVFSKTNKGYTPRFPQSGVDMLKRFKQSLYYSIRTGAREYNQMLDGCGMQNYLRQTKQKQADFIYNDCSPVIIRFRNLGAFSDEKAQQIKDSIREILKAYDLGKHGEKGTYMVFLKTDIYDDIIKINQL
jgi:hypothetical protein